MTHILLTNDDGIHAAGLKALAAGLEGFATVSVVAPSREQSGAAQSLTLRQPIICHSVGERQWAVEGTPGADNQVQVNAQVLTAMMDLDADPQASEPRGIERIDPQLPIPT